jgi:NAD(P)-dependent dehydrogenase (short-subunit alcohol dehydrogenase family)
MSGRLAQLTNMRGRVALVTGAAGHVGQVAAETLAEMGADLLLTDLDQSRLDGIAADLAARFSVRVVGAAVDLANEAALRALPLRAEAELGGLDAVLHSAAFVGTSGLKNWAVPFEQQGSEAWRAALEVNLTSAFVLTQAATPLLAKSGHGAIVLLSSIYGLVGPDMRLYEGLGMGNPAAYAASKGGLIQLARWLATTVAPQVRVNVISPGGIWRNQPELFVERYKARTPMGRMATEDDLVGAIAYLCSDLSAYVTGQNLVVDGGWCSW